MTASAVDNVRRIVGPILTLTGHRWETLWLLGRGSGLLIILRPTELADQLQQRAGGQLIKVSYVLASVCLLPATIVAQAEQATPEEIQALVQDVFERHSIVVDGAADASELFTQPDPDSYNIVVSLRGNAMADPVLERPEFAAVLARIRGD